MILVSCELVVAKSNVNSTMVDYRLIRKLDSGSPYKFLVIALIVEVISTFVILRYGYKS